jgi:hypothetical protein
MVIETWAQLAAALAILTIILVAINLQIGLSGGGLSNGVSAVLPIVVVALVGILMYLGFLKILVWSHNIMYLMAPVFLLLQIVSVAALATGAWRRSSILQREPIEH